jgi:signal transduction histidine kinase
VAEMHEGHVSVDSAPGKGSTFTLRIPISNAPEDQRRNLEIEEKM